MDSIEIQQLREKLHLTQAQFGQLLGVHPMTVSKWERESDKSEPSPYQVAMMEKFREAANTEDAKKVGAVLVGAGVVAAIFLLLSAVMSRK